MKMNTILFVVSLAIMSAALEMGTYALIPVHICDKVHKLSDAMQLFNHCWCSLMMFCEHDILVSNRYLQHVSVIKHPDMLTLLFCTSERRALTRFSLAHSYDKLLSCRRIMMGPRVTADTLADNLADNQASDVATNMAAAAQPNVSYTSMCWASYRDLAKLKLISAPCNCWWWGCLQIWWTNLQIHDSVRLSWQVTIEPSNCSWALKLSLEFTEELTICHWANTLQPSWQSAICWVSTVQPSWRPLSRLGGWRKNNIRTWFSGLLLLQYQYRADECMIKWRLE